MKEEKKQQTPQKYKALQENIMQNYVNKLNNLEEIENPYKYITSNIQPERNKKN